MGISRVDRERQQGHNQEQGKDHDPFEKIIIKITQRELPKQPGY